MPAVGANQRLTIDLAVRRAMLNRAWPGDGDGINGGDVLADLDAGNMMQFGESGRLP